VEQIWGDVDGYLTSLFAAPDDALAAAVAAGDAAGLPPIQVSPPQGALLQLLARSVAARRILELGTLAGYSTIWLARALPAGSDGDGEVVTLEFDPHHAEVARQNLERAGVSDLVDIRVGPALETLPTLAAERARGAGPFDFVFLDADKANLPAYFSAVLDLTRPGGLIVTDNVVRDGRVGDPASTDVDVQGARGVLELMATHPRVTATAIQTVGSKGYDGFAIALVTG
jgi:predicted O-methyltransferase YrrM